MGWYGSGLGPTMNMNACLRTDDVRHQSGEVAWALGSDLISSS
jgi:hypothetical protein